ncbi:MAG: TolC family protein [Myxococcota bacterium]
MRLQRHAAGVVAVCLGAVFAASAVGQTLEPSLQLTPRSAAAEALRANPDLRAAYQAIEVARGRLVQAGLWPNPELDLAGRDDFAFEGEGERGASVELAQPFPIAGRLARARDLALVDVAIALAEVREFERDLIGEVQGSVVALLALDRAISDQSRVIEAAGKLAVASEARFRAAEVSEADVNLLQIELARFEQDLRLLELEHRTEELRLNQLLDRPPEAEVPLAGDLQASHLEVRAGLEEDAMRRRPDLQRLRLEQDRAGAEARLARAEAWEDWTIGVGYDFDRQVFAGEPPIDPIGVKRDDFLGLSLTVPLPVFDRNQGRIAAARAEERRAGARIAGRRRAIEREVGTALGRVEELARVMEEYRDRIVPRTTRNVSLLERGYREGLVGIAELVQAEQQYADAAVRYARTLGELRQAEVALETASAASPLLDPDRSKGVQP